MMLKQYQEEFANKNRQFIFMNAEGVVIESDQRLFDIPISSSILELHPFFESLPALFDSTEEEFDFFCIHLAFNENTFITDVKLRKKMDGFLLIITDLTEHYDSYQSVTQSRNESVIKTELTVLKNLELQERERFKNRFIHNFSHELRNPLTSIMAIIDILDATEMTTEQSKMLDFLKESNSNLRLMLEDTLSIGMIDAGKLEIQHKLFNLRKFFELMQFTYTAKAKKKGLKFVSSWDYRIPEFVEGDRLRLFQIVTNLLDNAVEYSEQGKVSFEIQFNQKRANATSLRFQVTDTGIGIPEESQEAIFESFHREQSEDRSKGTGLGLTIVKRLLELMNSKIQLKSEPDKGSVFYFDMSFKYPLPSESRWSEHSNKKAVDKGVKARKKYKILLVEDDEYVQLTLFKILLNTDNFQIDLAYDGALVLQEVVNNDYDLILMDVDLPNLTGIQITKLIRDFPFKNIKNVPIIGITANAYQENLDMCIAAGMNDVVIKPYEKEKLLNIILKKLK
ncbi:hybrid sensor histidine kinase/response regulator [Maribacter sp. 2308TA10-17]|uniref:hybrid sensor histidine kinase/response regulator n=1 Tax=Maribacter sp. 2308TA10-17 TaxID=3386276 RepID=UPI0039BD35DA